MVASKKTDEQNASKQTKETLQPRYTPPQVLEVFALEALAVVCTDSNAKTDVALGCNPGALFS